MAQQPPPQAPTPPPPAGYAPPATPQQNGLAIAGMVVGIASVVLFFLAWIGSVVGVVGLILSILGLNKAKQMNGVGRGMAIAGLVTSAAGILIGIILTIVVIQRQNEIENQLEDLFGQVVAVPMLLRRRFLTR